MKIILPLSEKRIRLIGLYLAEFALEFVPGDQDAIGYDANDFLVLFDAWYENFIRYAETNHMISVAEVGILTENPGELDGFIKEAAIDAARETCLGKSPVFPGVVK